MAYSILFIEDNEDILQNLFSWFEASGFICDCARNGVAGLELATSANIDCIVLDLMLPGLDGLQLCKNLRQKKINTPIIMLTAKDTVADKITGLESGADDYLVKPFSLKELEARIRALLRRSRQIREKFEYGCLELDSRLHTACRQGKELRLSPACFKILEALMTEAPGVVRREQMERLLWGDNPPDGSALRNHIHELRKVLDKPFNFPVLETVPHIGWRLKYQDYAQEI